MINLTTMPRGSRYEDTYGGWLDIFERVATTDSAPFVVHGPPVSWASLLTYLGADVVAPQVHFPEDRMLRFVADDIHQAVSNGRLRELVEMHSTLRPELVDALYKSDVEWPTCRRRHTMQKRFNVTCNGSFFRPEVMTYLRNFERYIPRKPKCVIVPCAADKPYPAPIHDAIIRVMERRGCRDEYEIIIATGVLGLLPESLWGEAPEYDAGLPNPWRLQDAVMRFFDRVTYNRVIVYSDYNAEAISLGFYRCANQPSVQWPLPGRYDKYINLVGEDNLALLEGVL